VSFRLNPDFMPSVRRGAKARVVAGAAEVRDEAVRLIEEPKSGEHWPGMPRRSSRPGDAPASQTGETASSVKVYAPVETEQYVSVAIGSDLVKARLLEGGTSRVAPRPFLRPGLILSRVAVLKKIGGGNG
jgi:hypothetical protein